MRALVVGAGAVGQVYGHHLALGGARVSLFVRPKYAAEARAGYDVIRIHTKRNRVTSRFEADEVLTNEAEVRSRTFDQIWITVPTPVLARGEMDGILDASGDATVVSLQPGMSVARLLAARVPPERTVFGIVGFQSFTAPLHGSTDPVEAATGPGIAYSFPPIIENQFSGLEHRVREVVDALRKGGVPAGIIPDAHLALALSSAMLMPIIATLEMAGWSFDAWRAGVGPSLAARAARQAMDIVAAEMGTARPPTALVMRGPIIALALAIARAFSPLDLETFFRYHFEKVGDQTRAMLDEYVVSGSKHDLPSEAIAELVSGLRGTEER